MRPSSSCHRQTAHRRGRERWLETIRRVAIRARFGLLNIPSSPIIASSCARRLGVDILKHRVRHCCILDTAQWAADKICTILRHVQRTALPSLQLIRTFPCRTPFAFVRHFLGLPCSSRHLHHFCVFFSLAKLAKSDDGLRTTGKLIRSRSFLDCLVIHVKRRSQHWCLRRMSGVAYCDPIHTAICKPC